MIPGLEEKYLLRDSLLDDIARDLVGLADPHEVEDIDDPPMTQYVCGMLFPEDAPPDSGELDIDEQDDADESHGADPGIARAASRFPSTCGITFAVDTADTGSLSFVVNAARYVPLDDEGQAADASTLTRERLLAARWRRQPLKIPPVEVALDAEEDSEQTLADGLSLFVRIRNPDTEGVAAVTAVLRNRLPSDESKTRDAQVFLQVKLSVEGTSSNGSGVFVDRSRVGASVGDDELASFRLLYRHARSFAVGHGCSASWVTSADDPSRAQTITTEFVPRAPVAASQSNPAIACRALSMKFCATASKEELREGLRELVSGYEAWIADKRDIAGQLPPELREAADRHILNCEEVALRMNAGIAHLETDDRSRHAFRLANEAMQSQRARSDWQKAGAGGDAPSGDGESLWRPFQLGFILLCLESTADQKSADRQVADLLWFPTGGGKTEAYLGLIAFTLFRRRLANSTEEARGVTVIMRYTLRLLTIQQFQRASLLICCCEALRRQTPQLGDAPISIGLWVGREATPNTLADAQSALTDLKTSPDRTTENPVQLRSCPWCAEPLKPKHYWVTSKSPTMVIGCPNKQCEYTDGLPVYVVDEDIYNHQPSLVIATADKFAAIANKEEVRELFGIRSSVRPPELIVQDELHLISGPLGTLAGLYETAIDFLCQANGAGPKVIASTATIRRADDQTSALFDRGMQQFPPPGLDARDSYFATEAPRDGQANRLYAGVMAPATSQTTAMVRVYARLLASVETSSSSNATRDPYWTLLGYFNSLRVLGGALLQVRDDVGSALRRMLGQDTSRPMEPIEMTSRTESGQIPDHLRRMSCSLGEDETPLDVVLATNMISVGVDIDRLGLMVVMGQPQGTSEYIQATSRVGRQSPGLIVTVFNPGRSRDRSHYESFCAYHSALYRQVESTSVTPFSSRSRDRALHAIFVALCRMTVPALGPDSGASLIRDHSDGVAQVEEIILDRVRSVSPDEVEATRDEIRSILTRWRAMAETHGSSLVYRSYAKPPKPALLMSEGEAGHETASFPTLHSLRNVDLESRLELLR